MKDDLIDPLFLTKLPFRFVNEAADHLDVVVVVDQVAAVTRGQDFSGAHDDTIAMIHQSFAKGGSNSNLGSRLGEVII